MASSQSIEHGTVSCIDNSSNLSFSQRKTAFCEPCVSPGLRCVAELIKHTNNGAFRHFRRHWQALWCRGATAGARFSRVAVILQLPATFVGMLRTTNIIERCFVEERRRTRPRVCFVNVNSVDRIIYSIFQRFNLEWKTRTLKLFTQAA